jgi:hypothetical protein
MSKKMMVLALAVASAALFALPAGAAAQTAHISGAVPLAFSVTGSGGTLSTTSDTTVNCTSTTGAGSFSTTTEGTLSLIFHGCTVVGLGVSCTTPGQSAGTITVSNKFDLIMFATNKPAVLLTPDSPSSSTELGGKKFLTEFSCFGVSTKVYGNGVIGTIHSPATPCDGVARSTYGVNFEKSAVGVQKHQVWTGTSYDLIRDGGVTSALEGTATLHLAQARSLTCTHVA